jgi:hypothetical protein
MLWRDRLKERDEKEGEEHRFRNRLTCFVQLIDQTEEGQKEFFFSVCERISVSKNPQEIRKKGEKEACLKHQVERRPGHSFLQISEEFVSNTRWRTFSNLISVPYNGSIS